jgi:hypothetical protein
VILAQITAPQFCAGLVLVDDVVTTAAPIISYMAEQGWTRDRVRDYCRTRGWSIRIVVSGDEIAVRAQTPAPSQPR